MHLDLVNNRWCTMCFAAGWIGLGYYDACLCIIDADTSLTVSRSKRSPIFSFLFFFQKSLILFPRIYIYIQKYKFSAVEDSVDRRCLNLNFLPSSFKQQRYIRAGILKKTASTASGWEYACSVLASCESDNVIFCFIYGKKFLLPNFLKHDLPLTQFM